MKRSGFTLIELLIVVLIIAILAAIAVPNFLEFQTRAKVSRAKSDLRALATAIEAYYVDEQSYPPCNSFAVSGNCAPLMCSNNYPVLERLSTPIAYMSVGVLQDAFLSKFFTGSGVYAGDEGDGTTLPGANANYPQEDDDPAGKVYLYQSVTSDERAIAGNGAAIGWLLGSVGPDLIRINMGGVLACNGTIDRPGCTPRGFETKFAYCHNLLYDPTNGSVSWGELYRSGGDINRDYSSVLLKVADIHK